MQLIVAFLMTLVLALTGAQAQTARDAAPSTELTFRVASADRRAVLVNAPPTGQRRPVVIVLHGGRGSADRQRARTTFDDLARAEGFAVVYAEGTAFAEGQYAWNTGYLLRRQVGGADDIAYLDRLIDLLIAEHGADASRIYMTGSSNGAMMTFVYAVRRPERLAAIAPIVGAMFTFDQTPSTPLPIMMINGARDNEVPTAGGMSRNPLVSNAQTAPYKGLDETVRFWVGANRSDETPVVETQGTVTTRTHAAKPGGAVTISVLDAAGGHGWPGSAALRDDNTPIMAFNGAEKAWSFFRDKVRSPAAAPAASPAAGAHAGAPGATSPARGTQAGPAERSQAPSAQAAGPTDRDTGRRGGSGARGRGPGADTVDADRDGVITLSEWLAAGRREQGFQFMDADRDGKVTPAELQAGMARLRAMRSDRGGADQP